jgi:hypothetical protein
MNVKENVGVLTSAVATIVAGLTDKAAASKGAGVESKKAIAALREYAVKSAEAGIATDKAAAFLADSMTAAKIPEGTVKAYRASYNGYRVAISEGANISDTGEGKPMTAPQAREYNVPADKREAIKLLADIRKEIAKRVKACDNPDTLAEIRDLLPEVAGEVKTVFAAPDPAAYFGDDSDAVADVREAAAA